MRHPKWDRKPPKCPDDSVPTPTLKKGANSAFTLHTMDIVSNLHQIVVVTRGMVFV